MRILSSALAIAFVLVSLTQVAQAQTSQDNPRLKQALERFPAADANKDGILTLEEAKAFREKNTATSPKGAAKAPEGGERRVYKTVGDVELPLYIYQPEGHKPSEKKPAIVFFFGGGWKAGSPSQFEQHCKHLANRGMVAITVEYRVSSRHPVKVEDCIEDAKSAMRWVRGHAEELGIDPERVAAGGGSAGGHLAACTEVMDDFNASTDDLKVSAKPNAIVLFNPFMGRPDGEPLETDRTRGPASKVIPLTYASKKQPPCIMFFGTADELLKGAEAFQQESQKAGNRCEIITYEGQGHGFFNYGKSDNKYYNLTVAETDKFLVGLGWISE